MLRIIVVDVLNTVNKSDNYLEF